MDSQFSERHLSRILIAIAILAVIIATVTLSVYLFNFEGGISNDHEKWGQFGDYLGGSLNPIFALLALIALLLTLKVQSRELAISADELRNSAQALSEQSKALVLQNFENRFFNMVSLHHQIVNGIDLRRGGEVTASGRDCFRIFYGR